MGTMADVQVKTGVIINHTIEDDWISQFESAYLKLPRFSESTWAGAQGEAIIFEYDTIEEAAELFEGDKQKLLDLITTFEALDPEEAICVECDHMYMTRFVGHICECGGKIIHENDVEVIG